MRHGGGAIQYKLPANTSAGTAVALYAYKMAAKQMALTPTYTGGKYTLTFANGATDTVAGVDPEGYAVVLNKAGKTPKAGCAADGASVALDVTYGAGGKGSLEASVPTPADLKKAVFRVCAKVGRACA